MELRKSLEAAKYKIETRVIDHPLDASFAIGLPALSVFYHVAGFDNYQIVPILMGAVYGTSRYIGNQEHFPETKPAA
jgi:hypothetical protein